MVLAIIYLVGLSMPAYHLCGQISALLSILTRPDRKTSVAPTDIFQFRRSSDSIVAVTLEWPGNTFLDSGISGSSLLQAIRSVNV